MMIAEQDSPTAAFTRQPFAVTVSNGDRYLLNFPARVSKVHTDFRKFPGVCSMERFFG